jgi:hypothetical protein
MREIVRAIAAERLKLERTLAWRLAIGAPLTIVLLNLIIVLQRRDAGRAEEVLLGFAQLTLTTWTIIVLPLYTALAAALVAALEHQGDNWKHLLALPVARRSIFVAKWVAGAGLLLVSSLVLPAAVGVATEILKALKPALRGAPVPLALVTIRSLQVFCAAVLMLSIQVWVSFRWRSFIAGLAGVHRGCDDPAGGVARAGRGTIVMYLHPGCSHGPCRRCTKRRSVSNRRSGENVEHLCFRWRLQNVARCKVFGHGNFVPRMRSAAFGRS